MTSLDMASWLEDAGARVSSRWRCNDDHPEAFVDVAREELERLDGAASFDYRDAVAWALRSKALPAYTSHDFAEPTLTIYDGRGFSFQLLFWCTSTTAIHQHSFAGAFRVMEGSALHCTYTFEASRSWDAALATGRLASEGVELLERGDIRPIVPGCELIHSVFHLGRPSVTLLLRSDSYRCYCPQFAYLWPGFAIDAEARDPSVTKQLELLRMLARAKHPELPAYTDAFLTHADLHALVRMIQETEQAIFIDGVRQKVVAAAERLGAGPTVDAAIHEAGRLSLLRRLRARISNDWHRYLLAVLLNAGSRGEMLRLIEARRPQANLDDIVDGFAGMLAEIGENSGCDENERVRSLRDLLVPQVSPESIPVFLLLREQSADPVLGTSA